MTDEITEESRQNERFRSQQMEALGWLAAGVAHDSTNILNVVLGYCQIVNSNPRLPHSHKRWFEESRKLRNVLHR